MLLALEKLDLLSSLGFLNSTIYSKLSFRDPGYIWPSFSSYLRSSSVSFFAPKLDFLIFVLRGSYFNSGMIFYCRIFKICSSILERSLANWLFWDLKYSLSFSYLLNFSESCLTSSLSSSNFSSIILPFSAIKL